MTPRNEFRNHICDRCESSERDEVEDEELSKTSNSVFFGLRLNVIVEVGAEGMFRKELFFLFILRVLVGMVITILMEGESYDDKDIVSDTVETSTTSFQPKHANNSLRLTK